MLFFFLKIDNSMDIMLRALLPVFLFLSRNRLFCLCIALTCCLIGSTSVSARKSGSKNVTVVFSHINAPYVFPDGSGISVDIVRQSLASQGYTLTPLLLPIKRGFQLFEEGQCDAVAIVQKNSLLPGAHYSDFFVHYHNFGIVLKNADKDWIQELKDIRFLDIIAYENAYLYLGEQYRDLVSSNKKYHETENQQQQVLLLMKGRTDIAIMDKSIFYYYHNLLLGKGIISPQTKVRFIDMFPPSRYRVAFKDKNIRDAFDHGISLLKKSGGYQSIYQKYNVHWDDEALQ